MNIIPGFAYIISTALISILLLAGRGARRGSADNNSTEFRYSRPVRFALLLCIPVWFVAAGVVRYTARPGSDAQVAGYFSLGFICAAVASTFFYLYAERFFVKIEGGVLQWRGLFWTHCLNFEKIDAIQLKKLNNGAERISIYKNKKSVLDVGGSVEGFFELKGLLELQAKKFAIPVSRS